MNTIFPLKFGSNMDKTQMLKVKVGSKFISNPTFGSVHLCPKFGLKQPALFECEAMQDQR